MAKMMKSAKAKAGKKMMGMTPSKKKVSSVKSARVTKVSYK